MREYLLPSASRWRWLHAAPTARHRVFLEKESAWIRRGRERDKREVFATPLLRLESEDGKRAFFVAVERLEVPEAKALLRGVKRRLEYCVRVFEEQPRWHDWGPLSLPIPINRKDYEELTSFFGVLSVRHRSKEGKSPSVSHCANIPLSAVRRWNPFLVRRSLNDSILSVKDGRLAVIPSGEPLPSWLIESESAKKLHKLIEARQALEAYRNAVIQFDKNRGLWPAPDSPALYSGPLRPEAIQNRLFFTRVAGLLEPETARNARELFRTRVPLFKRFFRERFKLDGEAYVEWLAERLATNLKKASRREAAIRVAQEIGKISEAREAQKRG